MIPISSTNSRIFGFKIDILIFAWTKPWLENPGSFEGFLKFFYFEFGSFDTNFMGAAGCGKKRPCIFSEF